MVNFKFYVCGKRNKIVRIKDQKKSQIMNNYKENIFKKFIPTLKKFV